MFLLNCHPILSLYQTCCLGFTIVVPCSKCDFQTELPAALLLWLIFFSYDFADIRGKAKVWVSREKQVALADYV